MQRIFKYDKRNYHPNANTLAKMLLNTCSSRPSSVGCTPKDSLSAPPVEGLYDARSSDFTHSPFRREQVRKGFLY